jgi:hypothetical protein
MEVLRFDSRYPDRKYRDWVLQLADDLITAPVISAPAAQSKLHGVFRGFEIPAEPGLVPVS